MRFPDAPLPESAGTIDSRAYYILIFLFTFLCLLPIWRLPFLPMQDYPQHLFFAYVVGSADNPAFDWSAHYEVVPRIAPYSLFYFLVSKLYRFVGIDMAGKFFFSIYILLVTALVIKASRPLPSGHVPWGLLLMFPFAFNQVYFLGFTNYVFSVPLLFILMLDFQELVSRRFELSSFIRHILGQIILFLCHPYTVLLYLGIASLSILLAEGGYKALRQKLMPLLFMVVLLFLWYALEGSMVLSRTNLRWWPGAWTFKFLLLMFTGMNLTTGVDHITLALWSAVGIFFLCFGIMRGRIISIQRYMLASFVLSLLGVFLLPFLSSAQYFNARLAPVIYFFVAVILARIKLPRYAGFAVAVLIGALLFKSYALQGKISRETAEVVPLAAQMERNSVVLPVMFDSTSNVLDPFFFYQMHDHDVYYYHILIGGGANSNTFSVRPLNSISIFPINLKQGVYLPPADLSKFDWHAYEPYYKYVLARGAPESFVRYMSENAVYAGRSGKWTLFRRKY